MILLFLILLVQSATLKCIPEVLKKPVPSPPPLTMASCTPDILCSVEGLPGLCALCVFMWLLCIPQLLAMELGVVSTRITAADRTEHMKRLRHTSRLPFAPGEGPSCGTSAFGGGLSLLSVTDDPLLVAHPVPTVLFPCSLEPAPGSPAQGAPQPAWGCS